MFYSVKTLYTFYAHLLKDMYARDFSLFVPANSEYRNK